MRRDERLMDLIALLLGAERPVTLERIHTSIPGYGQPNIAAFKRMFERDKSDLRAMGIPIKNEPVEPFGEETGYRIPKEEYYLPEIDFTPEEKLALLLLGSLPSLQVVPLSGEAVAALHKLGPDLRERGSPAWRRQLPMRFAPAREPEERLKALCAAAAARHRVRFVYHSLGGDKAQERELDPYGLYFEQGAWYVVGHCHLRDEIRSFRVSRIESEVSRARTGGMAPDFERPPDFRIDDYSTSRPWEFEDGAEQEARVYFSPHIAWQVERELGGIYAFEADEDGGGVLRMSVRNEDAFLAWVLSFADDAEVLSPPRLRERMRERLEGMLEGLGHGGDD